MTAAAPDVPPVPAAAPVRIESIALTNFRAFPGPAAARFQLHGKNLLVYGENGAGKSSLFHAIADFFSYDPRPLQQYNNVFSGYPVADCKVTVELVNDAQPLEWTSLKHPCVYDFKKPVVNFSDYFFAGSDPRITQAAQRAACLDYKSLLNTNFRHGSGEVNLFEIAVEHLLRDYPVSQGGKSSTIGTLWGAVKRSKPEKHNPTTMAKINQACVDFNTAFQPALQVLLPKINVLMHTLGWPEVVLTALRTPGLTYQPVPLKRDRIIEGQTLTPELTFRGHQPQNHPFFLNEARLSALGLAMYFAGRLASTPTTTPEALKLLVLDDVLVGLDHSNRLPVLNVLVDLFPDWQVVLLTHDKGWFDLARQRLSTSDWTYYEVYEGDLSAAAPMPIVRKTLNRPAPALLEKARALLTQGYMEAAANYVRQAFEAGIRAACEFKNIKLPYKQDVTHHKAQDLLTGLKGWTGTVKVPKADWDAALHRLELMKDVVMNPYSHPNAPNIPRQEIVEAADAVDKFLQLARKN